MSFEPCELLQECIKPTGPPDKHVSLNTVTAVSKKGQNGCQMSDLIRDRLFQRINFELQTGTRSGKSRLSLATMKRLMVEIGHPDRSVPIIHVAGTKGKGSTSLMIAQILRQTGRRVGLYTSPHLEKLEERYWIDGELISSENLDRLITQVMQAADRIDQELDLKASEGNGTSGSPEVECDEPLLSPTFFEITTAVAFVAFQEAGVDVAVIETGMGGRLDSTNVCLPVISVITNIDLDHTQFLGDTVDKIAAEKGGIIKPLIPVVSGVTQPEAKSVLESIAAKRNSPLFQLGRDFGLGQLNPSVLNQTDSSSVGSSPDNKSFNSSATQPFEVWLASSSVQGSQGVQVQAEDQRKRVTELRVGMPGRHQQVNASLAVAACERLNRLGWKIDEDQIRAGLAASRFTVRIEFDDKIPDLVFDMAHNVPSLKALIATLNEIRPGQPRLLAFAVSRDKDREGMMELIADEFDQVIISTFLGNPRATKAEVLFEQLQQFLKNRTNSRLRMEQVSLAPTPQEAMKESLRRRQPGELICVAGSIFFAGEMKRAFMESDCVPVVS